uniref:Uncharacterized protein n=1 Tax=Gossypium raimondii TaxID=29730 RepID=A0A0D2QZG7_GOSRA|nr:hypothetical protein B456_010G110600 [Gossypium raimondii]
MSDSAYLYLGFCRIFYFDFAFLLFGILELKKLYFSCLGLSVFDCFVHLPGGFHWFHRSSTVSLFFILLKVQNSCFIYLRCFHYQCNGLNGLD